jgi:hypothetical protein
LHAAGAAGFFIKLDKQEIIVRGISKYTPNPENRIEHFQNSKVTMGCTGNKDFKDDYKKMVALLPK